MSGKPGPMLDLSGQRFGRLTAISYAHSNEGDWGAQWNCICDCGKPHIARAAYLRAGRVKSCGCARGGHNALGDGYQNHPFAQGLYLNMVQRCTNPNSLGYDRYGGRGIYVYSPWLYGNGFKTGRALFIEWIEANLGPKPSDDHSLDRKDNDGNYEPGNLRWASPVEQARNKHISNQHGYHGYAKD